MSSGTDKIVSSIMSEAQGKADIIMQDANAEVATITANAEKTAESEKNKILEKVETEAEEYAKSVKIILKTRGLFLKTILMSVAFHILVSMISFFVLTAFGGEVDFLPCFVTTVAITSAVYFVPTPGNAGAAEGTFYVVFSALSEGYVFWAMLVWRFFSYYIYIIMGGVTYFFMHLEKKRKQKATPADV